MGFGATGAAGGSMEGAVRFRGFAAAFCSGFGAAIAGVFGADGFGIFVVFFGGITSVSYFLVASGFSRKSAVGTLSRPVRK